MAFPIWPLALSKLVRETDIIILCKTIIEVTLHYHCHILLVRNKSQSHHRQGEGIVQGHEDQATGMIGSILESLLYLHVKEYSFKKNHWFRFNWECVHYFLKCLAAVQYDLKYYQLCSTFTDLRTEGS